MALSREQAGRRLRMVTINVRILTRLDLLGEEGPGPRAAPRALGPAPPPAGLLSSSARVVGHCEGIRGTLLHSLGPRSQSAGFR